MALTSALVVGSVRTTHMAAQPRLAELNLADTVMTATAQTSALEVALVPMTATAAQPKLAALKAAAMAVAILVVTPMTKPSVPVVG